MRTVDSPIPGSSPCVLAPFSRLSQRTNTCSHTRADGVRYELELDRGDPELEQAPSRTTRAIASAPIRSATISRWRSVAEAIAVAVELEDHVADPDAGELGGAAGDDLDHLHPALGAGRRPRPRRQRRRAAGDPEVGAADAAVGDQRGDDPLRGRGHRDREAEPDPGDGGVDADQPSAAVGERAAGVAGVERGVGLDHVVDHPHAAAGAGRAARGRAPRRRRR